MQNPHQFVRLLEEAPETLDQVDNGDGSWSYALDRDFDPEARSQLGALTWRYARQARYSWDPQPATGEKSFVYEPPVAQTAAEQLVGTWRTDDAGRVWEVESVDEAMLTHDEHPGDDVDEAEVFVPSADPADQEPEPGELVTWQPMNWTGLDCQTGNGNEGHFWDGESRSSISASSTSDRQKTAVRISSAGGGSCSGAMVGPTWVLTGAHCLFDANDNQVLDSSITVMLPWASESQVGVVDVFIPSGWSSPGTDYDDDYALILLSNLFDNDPGDMHFSNASDAVLNGIGSNFHNLGFPGWFPGCQNAFTFPLVHSPNSEVTSKFTTTLRWKGDATVGQSGGPLYYCPDGSDSACGPGEFGAVVSVLAGWNGVWLRWVGPRSSNFRDWALDTMDDNTCMNCHP